VKGILCALLLLVLPVLAMGFTATPLSDVTKPLYLYASLDLSRTAPTTDQAAALLFEGQSRTFTLNPSLATSLTLDGVAEITTNLLLSRFIFGATQNLTITISASASGVIATESFVIAMPGSATMMNFDVDVVGSPPASLAAGEVITLTLTHVAGAGFRIMNVKPSDGTTHSSVDFATDTAINIEDIRVFDASYPAGSEVTSSVEGDTVYVRATVSDPFGSFDITGAAVDIESATSTPTVTAGAMTENVNAPYPTASQKLYEYTYSIPDPADTGTWQISVTADEGSEGTVSHIGTHTWDVTGGGGGGGGPPSCETIFPDTMQGRTASSAIRIRNSGQVLGDTELSFPSIIDQTGGGHNSCDTADCTVTGSSTAALTLPAFVTTATPTDVTISSGSESIGPGGTYNLTEIDELRITNSATVAYLTPPVQHIVTDGRLRDDSVTTFNPGEYWFDDLTIEHSAQVIINGPVTIYVRQRLDIKDSAQVNSGGAAEDLALVGYGDIRLEDDVIVKSVLYAGDDVEIRNDAQFTGSISVDDRVELRNNGTVTYESVTGVSVGSLCAPPASTNIDHYEIVHDGEGLTCEAESITIRACMDAGCSTLSSDLITLDFQADGVTQSSPSFTGSTAVSLSQTTPDTLTLSVANETIAADNALVCTGSGSSCDVVFTTAGFRFLYSATNDTTVPSQVAGSSFADALKVQAVKDTNGVCTGIFTGNVDVELAQQSISPGNISTLDFTLSGTPIEKNPSSGVSNYTVTALSFGASSIATLTLPVYEDAGQIRVHANYDVGGVTLSGSSNSFWVRPDKLVVTAKSGATDLDAATATGMPVQAAGAAFDLEITAQNSAGVTTPNYQPGQIQFLLQRTGPAPGGVDGLFVYAPGGSMNSALAPVYTDVSPVAFSNGVSSSSVASFSEVGLLNLDLQDDDYGMAGLTVPGDAIDIGRFTPDHFVVSTGNAGSFQAECTTGTDFTYVGQAFGYLVAPVFSIEPYEATGTTVTQNYQGTFMHLSSGEVALAYPVSDNSNSLVVVATPASAALSEDGDGTLSLTLNFLDVYTYTRPGVTEIAPFTADLTVSVTAVAETLDGISATGLPEDLTPVGSEQRFGRLAISNAFGSEVSSLPVATVVEHYNASGAYATNTDDSCSDPASQLSTVPDSVPSGSHANIPVGGGTTNIVYNSPVILGDAGFVLSAPGAANTGDVVLTIDLSSMLWLQYDWDGDGSLDATPERTATFGQYRGHDRVIYWREVLP
jgi:hypothetical protein